MSKEQTNYRIVRELISFASATEGDLSALLVEEANERLQSQGIDPQELAKATNRRLSIIRNEINARRAAEQAEMKSRRTCPETEISRLAIAARTESAADPDDIEILKKLSQPDIDDDDAED